MRPNETSVCWTRLRPATYTLFWLAQVYNACVRVADVHLFRASIRRSVPCLGPREAFQCADIDHPIHSVWYQFIVPCVRNVHHSWPVESRLILCGWRIRGCLIANMYRSHPGTSVHRLEGMLLVVVAVSRDYHSPRGCGLKIQPLVFPFPFEPFGVSWKDLIEYRIPEVGAPFESPAHYRTPKAVALAYVPYGRSPCDHTFRNPWEWNEGFRPHNHVVHTAGPILGQRRVHVWTCQLRCRSSDASVLRA